MRRRFEFTVDREHARTVNEVAAYLRRIRVLAIAASVVLGVGTGYLIWLDHPWSYLLAVAFALGAATALFVGLWTPHRARIDKLYATGALVPAVVSESTAKGTTLLALVDLAKPTADGPRYALVTRTVRSLPGHRIRAGERVPSVIVRIDRAPASVGELWHAVTMMPIAWGTRDLNIIERARTTIHEVEWQLLTDNLDLAAKVRRVDAKRLLIDPQQLPDELRGT
ncbi:DUF3239 domain-containing protein [Nocardia otitidiscaviarum]|uniref:DUF3239 domain-containing protein n=1 Tax=Nocardia otitidiscaviarum TaxID=1823 RepID=UPI0004A6C1F8|nr:DUF3239 domain-containing protein [Nocardia otitidiscaviarum]MBF6134020.1 DUF3239 domain-containing protein [Nocardia otitidiscaviarum]MBF6484319.1 DUF3239 domain-containing protein [Nocardia otitidiscaviarum]